MPLRDTIQRMLKRMREPKTPAPQETLYSPPERGPADPEPPDFSTGDQVRASGMNQAGAPAVADARRKALMQPVVIPDGTMGTVRGIDLDLLFVAVTGEFPMGAWRKFGRAADDPTFNAGDKVKATGPVSTAAGDWSVPHNTLGTVRNVSDTTLGVEVLFHFNKNDWFNTKDPGRRYWGSLITVEAGMLDVPPNMLAEAQRHLQDAFAHFAVRDLRKAVDVSHAHADTIQSEIADYRALFGRSIDQDDAAIAQVKNIWETQSAPHQRDGLRGEGGAWDKKDTVWWDLHRAGKRLHLRYTGDGRWLTYTTEGDEIVERNEAGDEGPSQHFDIDDAAFAWVLELRAYAGDLEEDNLWSAQSNAEDYQEQLDRLDDIEVTTAPATSEDGGRGDAAYFEVPMDLDEWRYRDEVESAAGALPAVVGMWVYPWDNDEGYGGFHHDFANHIWFSVYIGKPLLDEHARRHRLRRALVTVEHELSHTAQALLTRAKELAGQAGTPERGLTEEKEGEEYRALPHAQRGIEFYPNLVNEVRNFEYQWRLRAFYLVHNARQLGRPDPNLDAARTEYARTWIAEEPRFEELRQSQPERYRRFVREFFKAVTSGQAPHPEQALQITSMVTVTAAKVDVWKSKYPEFAQVYDYLNANDPSGRGKYLDWAARQVTETYYDPEEGIDPEAAMGLASQLVSQLQRFDQHKSKMPTTDINRYPNMLRMQRALEEAEERQSKTEQERAKKREGASTVYEDDTLRVYHIKTHDAACRYGKGSKWCITQDKPTHWDTYAKMGAVQYMAMIKGSNEKFAFTSYPTTGVVQIWDAGDTLLEEDDTPPYIMRAINQLFPERAPPYTIVYVATEYDSEWPELASEDLARLKDAVAEKKHLQHGGWRIWEYTLDTHDWKTKGKEVAWGHDPARPYPIAEQPPSDEAHGYIIKYIPADENDGYDQYELWAPADYFGDTRLYVDRFDSEEEALDYLRKNSDWEHYLEPEYRTDPKLDVWLEMPDGTRKQLMSSAPKPRRQADVRAHRAHPNSYPRMRHYATEGEQHPPGAGESNTGVTISHPHADGAIPNEQAVGLGESAGEFYSDVASQYGTLSPGSQTDLMHYDYTPHADAIDALARRYGYDVYVAGGKYGKPDLATRNYNTGHLMIYDPTPKSGGDFGDEQYTKAWRTIHELAHALVYPALNEKYGEGRRIGKLGYHRTLHEAKRAVEWEWRAAHKQRELNEELGYRVDDATFNRELNTVLHDAIHRAVTGKFTNPDQEGFTPSDKKIPLEVAMRTLENAAHRLGLKGEHDLLPKRRASTLVEVTSVYEVCA